MAFLASGVAAYIAGGTEPAPHATLSVHLGYAFKKLSGGASPNPTAGPRSVAARICVTGRSEDEISPTTFSSNGFDLDHTSFAVHDILSWARRLRADLGATPIFGEVLRDFRYLLLYIGDAEAGARLELMEPCRSGFLDRYLAKHREGPHHLTFMVPDLDRVVADVQIVGIDSGRRELRTPTMA